MKEIIYEPDGTIIEIDYDFLDENGEPTVVELDSDENYFIPKNVTVV